MSKEVQVTDIKPPNSIKNHNKYRNINSVCCEYVVCGYKLMAIEMFSRINKLKIEQKYVKFRTKDLKSAKN